MAKIDCSVTENYAAETIRVCRMYSDCSDCPFGAEDAVCPRGVFEYDRERAKQVIAALQKWSDEHPQKTRLDDLKEKYPNYRFYENDQCPDRRPAVFGYCDNCLYCRNSKQTLRYCWDEPVNGDATGKAVE